MRRPRIDALDSDDAEHKIGYEHGVSVADVEDLLDLDDWVIIRNKNTHPAAHHRFVGAIPDGRMLTAILRPTSEEGLWVLISAWWSNEHEVRLFDEATRHRDR